MIRKVGIPYSQFQHSVTQSISNWVTSSVSSSYLDSCFESFQVGIEQSAVFQSRWHFGTSGPFGCLQNYTLILSHNSSPAFIYDDGRVQSYQHCAVNYNSWSMYYEEITTGEKLWRSFFASLTGSGQEEANLATTLTQCLWWKFEYQSRKHISVC